MNVAKDLTYLTFKLLRLGEAVEKDVVEFTNTVALNVHDQVVFSTPVDEGTARSNWIVRVGRPWRFVYRAFSPGKRLGRVERGNYSASVRQAEAALGRRKKNLPIYINNNLPYITRLNRGYSRQSPAGFVQSSIAIGIKNSVSEFRFNNIKRVFR